MPDIAVLPTRRETLSHFSPYAGRAPPSYMNVMGFGPLM